MGILNDEVLQTDSKGAKLCIGNAKNFIQILANPSPSDKRFTEEIVAILNKPIDDALGCGKVDSEKMWSGFHKLWSSEEYSTKWRSYLSSNNSLVTKSLFYQHVTIELFEQLLCDKLQDNNESTNSSIDVSISHEEENAIRYMGGYVIRKLNKKQYSVDCLIEKNKDSIAETSSTEWVNLIDRGGLVHVTEQCHQLFLSIEYITRHHMSIANLKSMDEDFCRHLENMIVTDDDVLFNWTMTGAENEEVLNEIIKLWLNIRGFSFAKSIMEKYKQESKKCTGKSKGLRTKLFTDQL